MCKCSGNFDLLKLLDKFYMYNNYSRNFCVKYKDFESEIYRNYKMWIFPVSFEESFWKFRGTFMEISYKIYENFKKIC